MTSDDQLAMLFAAWWLGGLALPIVLGCIGCLIHDPEYDD